jgi:hypothetical protein
MKAIAFMVLCVMTACATDQTVAREGSDEQGVVCDPDCDPANMQTVLNALIGEGQHVGRPAGPAYCRVSHGYDDYGNYESWNECSNTYQGSDQQYLVDCADRLGTPICGTVACGDRC